MDTRRVFLSLKRARAASTREGEEEEEIVFEESVSDTTTVADLKRKLVQNHRPDLQDFALVYQNQLLQDGDLVRDEILATDEWPTFHVAIFQQSAAAATTTKCRVHLKFLNKNMHREEIEAANVGEVRAAATALLKSKLGGGILVDLQCNAESIIHLADSHQLAALDGAQNGLVLCVVSGGGGLMQKEEEEEEEAEVESAFYAKFIEAQFAKDRLTKMNDMNFNHQVLAGAIDVLASRREMRGKLQQVLQSQQDASALLLKALEAYTQHFASKPSSHFSPTPTPSQQQQQRQEQPEAAAAAPVVVVQANQPAAAAAGERRAERRMRIVVGLDIGLLFKILLLLVLLGYDSSRQEFMIMCFIAAIIYFSSIGLVRMPAFMANWFAQREWGRIPPAARNGFLIDLYSVLLSLLLSISPAWVVQSGGGNPPQPENVPAAAAAGEVEPEAEGGL